MTERGLYGFVNVFLEVSNCRKCSILCYRMNPFIRIHPEVRRALDNRTPVVALESTIIAHGMAYPGNLEMAIEVETLIRSEGAVPATIALLNGKMCIGLDESELTLLAEGGRSIGKVSRRDVAWFLSHPVQVGATTVSATMLAAHAVGIRVFATGGIGGVHRGADVSWDVSADLFEFTRSGVAVISAGAKAILDLPATIEYLETLGVPVVGYRTDEFPAFYSRSSGQKVPMQVETVESLAEFLHAYWQVIPDQGVLIANPVPEDAEIRRDEIEPYILRAIERATAEGVSGKDLTPFLLRELSEQTQGRSVRTNVALVRSNAILGAQLACALHRLP